MLPIDSDCRVEFSTKERVPGISDILFFFKHCFSPGERKFKVILLVQLCTGLRISEVVAMNLSDFLDPDFRTVNVLLQKKIKVVDGVKRGKNVIATKHIPECAAAHLRAWIVDNLDWIRSKEGYIFPHTNNRHNYIPAHNVQNWLCKKRQILSASFPDRSFGKVLGYRHYKGDTICFGKNIIVQRQPIYMWSTHLMRRICGTFMYLQEKDPVFVQHFLGHSELKTTNKHYIDSAQVMGTFRNIKAVNRLFDRNFYEEISTDNELVSVPSVFDVIRK